MDGSSEVWRINSTALKINEAFDSARSAARDEALWLSAKCRELLADNDRLRIENEKLRAASSQGSGSPSPMFKVGDRVRSKKHEAHGWTDLVVVALNHNGRADLLLAIADGGKRGGFYLSDLEHAEGSKT
jgi:hypothetical protein